MADKSTYNQRGVSSSKQDVHSAISKIDKGLYPRAFCKIVEDYLTGNSDYGIVMHADGAGTKSSLAYAYWKETGDISVWRGIVQDVIAMNIDDLACVGALQEPILYSSCIGRNKYLIDKDVLTALIQETENILGELRDDGIEIRSTGGETADLGDLVRTVVVDSTVLTRIHKNDVIDNANVQAGDAVVGLASFGKAKHEKQYNSGIGSNGLTSARHDIFNKQLGKDYPETFNPNMPSDLRYTGSYSLTDTLEGTELNMGQAVLSPTRIYAPCIAEILKSVGKQVNGMVHCSGGGQTKILHFIDKLHVVKNNLFATPILFKIIQQQSKTSWREMYQTFNMGHRMELYLNSEVASDVIAIANKWGIEAQIVGEVKLSTQKKLTLKTEYGTFEYA